MRDEPLELIGIREGDVLASKYRIEQVLGVGGMGIVAAAHHLKLDRRVAIKFLLPDSAANSEVVGRFIREARAAARIQSEHIAHVIDVDTLPDGMPYMVMEHLEGGDLSQVLKTAGPLPMADAADYLLQASVAVAEAHALGIVHRDLKPANLYLCQRLGRTPVVKVLDFGISKVTLSSGSGADHAVTATHAMFGSPLYMSPEHMMSTKEVDHRTDIWSLGVILYELLTGKTPFEGDSLPQLAIAVLQQEPPPLRTARPDLPIGLEKVVARCLEKDRAKRYQNVGELAASLVDFAPKRARASFERISQAMVASGMSSTSVLPPSSAALRLAPATTAPESPMRTGGSTEAPWAQTQRKSPRSGALSALFATGAVFLAVGGAFAVWRIRTAAPAPAASERAQVPASAVPPFSVPVPPPPAAIPPSPLPAPSVEPSREASVVALKLPPSTPLAATHAVRQLIQPTRANSKAPSTATQAPIAQPPSPTPTPRDRGDNPF